VKLLRAVAEGHPGPDVALQRWPLSDREMERQSATAAAWHELSHFEIDEDLRARDPDYAVYQKSQLLEHAAHLEKLIGTKGDDPG
jgi:hypothetical protein